MILKSSVQPLSLLPEISFISIREVESKANNGTKYHIKAWTKDFDASRQPCNFQKVI